MFCRPTFFFAKETTQLMKEETMLVLEDIKNLVPSICNTGYTQISVMHEFLLTITDRKVCNVARWFFSNPKLSAQITELDAILIKQFDVLLRTDQIFVLWFGDKFS